MDVSNQLILNYDMLQSVKLVADDMKDKDFKPFIAFLEKNILSTAKSIIKTEKYGVEIIEGFSNNEIKKITNKVNATVDDYRKLRGYLTSGVVIQNVNEEVERGAK